MSQEAKTDGMVRVRVRTLMVALGLLEALKERLGDAPGVERTTEELRASLEG